MSNTARFPADSSEIVQLKAQLDRSLINMNNDFRICNASCSQCNHSCIRLAVHEGKHDCETIHDCDGQYEYGIEHEDLCEDVPRCGLRYV